tara:strand:- start:4317 stop:4793 length:477 start_codon:yes stop_codon:yes gene_type:complete
MMKNLIIGVIVLALIAAFAFWAIKGEDIKEKAVEKAVEALVENVVEEAVDKTKEKLISALQPRKITATINCAEGYSHGATSLTVFPLSTELPVGTILIFPGGDQFMLTSPAVKNATTIVSVIGLAGSVVDKACGKEIVKKKLLPEFENPPINIPVFIN